MRENDKEDCFGLRPRNDKDNGFPPEFTPHLMRGGIDIKSFVLILRRTPYGGVFRV
jgi:hypothetical protein